MTADEVLRQLEALGTAQNRKVYSRHGVGTNQYGVSYANLKALVKKIKKNQAVAEGLWGSGNHDARVLATMVADPSAVTEKVLEAWARDLDNYVLTDALSQLAARTQWAHKKIGQWTGSSDEWRGQCGWNMVAILAASEANLPDAFCEELLEKIENEIRCSKNRVRHSMNNALIAIGLRGGALEKSALRAAGRIGRVEVNHGETGCKTPEAAEYIRKGIARKKGKGS